MSPTMNRVQGFLRKLPGRLLRLGLFVLLLLFLVQRLVLPLLVPVATNAIVSARVVQVKSPINGVVSGPAPVAGIVPAGQTLVSVEDPLADDQRRRDLELLYAERVEDVARLRRELRACDALLVQREREYREYKDHVYQRLLLEQKAAESQLAIAEEVSRHSGEHGEVHASLARSSPSLTTRLDRADVRRRESVARHEETVAKVRLETARDLTRQAPMFVLGQRPEVLWRAADLRLHSATLAARLREAEAVLIRLSEQCGQEKLAAARRAKVSLTAPTAGSVSRVLRGPGEHVRAGETVLEMRDDDLFVVALFTRRHAAIPLGSRALITTPGGRTTEGTVVLRRPYRPDPADTPFILPEANDFIEVRFSLSTPVEGAAVGLPVDVVLLDGEPSPLIRALLWLRRCFQ